MDSHFFAPLFQTADSEPDRPFSVLLIGAERIEVSYAAMATHSGRWAACLRQTGVGTGDVVIIMIEHGLDLYAAFVGATMLGAVPAIMPLSTAKQDPALFWPAHKALFARIRPKALVTSERGGTEIKTFLDPDNLAVITPRQVAEIAPDLALHPVDKDSLLLLQHSSGTTSLKKGVALSHGAVRRQVSAYARALGYRRGESIASWLPLYHDMGLVTSFLMPAVMGSTIVSLDPFEWVMRPHRLFEAMQEHGCAWTWMPNFAFEHLVRTDDPEYRFELAQVRGFVNCSEPCKRGSFARFLQQFERHGVQHSMLQTCYAMAETVFAITQSSPARPPAALRDLIDVSTLPGGISVPDTVSVGDPIEGMEVQLLDASGTAVPDGVPGEIAVRAPYLFEGYFKLPEATRAAFLDDWYRTGDIGVRVAAELFIIGRTKDLIIVHGKNIVAHQIEELMAAIQGIKPGRSVAFGVHDEFEGSEGLVVVAELSRGDMPQSRVIRRAVRESIFNAVGIYPSKVLLTEPGWLVKTTSGKISREENRKKYLAGMQ